MSNRKTGKPTLTALAFILRNRSLWPDGFEWEFSSCKTCAMGLAHEMWPAVVKETSSEAMCEAFEIPHHVANDIFCIRSLPSHLYREWDTVDVTPEVVADRIDEYCINEYMADQVRREIHASCD